MKRVMIIGQPGSGKSTLAARLGEITGLPVFHIDREVHWLPNWIERDPAEKSALCAAIHAKDEWIFEGGQSKTWPDRVSRADTIIWLDLPFPLRAFRVMKRRVMYNSAQRPDMADNCPERLNGDFVRWIWNTRKTGRELMRQTFEAAPQEKTLLHFQTSKSVNTWLTEVATHYG